MITQLILIIVLLVAALVVQGLRHRDLEREAYNLGRERERRFQESRYLSSLFGSMRN